MKKISIIGVPEHFNLPWHLAIEENAFEERGIQLEWTDVPEGTGRMCKMLENNETDLAIILTEGITKSITEGNPSRIIQEYISTPLQWGIHVAAQSQYYSIADLAHKKVAISRLGSGSHLMAYVNAKKQGWNTANLKFEIVNNLDNAVVSLTKGEADYFMWEHFTTKPLVDNNTFRRIADCPTPWPCFVIAGNYNFIANNVNTIKHILEIINLYTSEFKAIPSIDRTLANRYQQQLVDIQEWLSMTRWSQSQLTPETLKIVQQKLIELNLITTVKEVKDIIY